MLIVNVDSAKESLFATVGPPLPSSDRALPYGPGIQVLPLAEKVASFFDVLESAAVVPLFSSNDRAKTCRLAPLALMLIIAFADCPAVQFTVIVRRLTLSAISAVLEMLQVVPTTVAVPGDKRSLIQLTFCRVSPEHE